MSTHSWTDIKIKLKEAALALPHFFKNPVQGMKDIPDWDWPTLLILQGAFALACGELKNLIERDIFGFFVDIVVSPLAAYIVTGFVAGLLFYGLKAAFDREAPFRGLYLHCVFAAIPLQISYIVTKFFPPVNLLGFAVAMYLLQVGLVHRYQVDKPRLKKILFGLFGAYSIWWCFQVYTATFRREGLKQRATPESLDILEKELNNDKGD